MKVNVRLVIAKVFNYAYVNVTKKSAIVRNPNGNVIKNVVKNWDADITCVK